jgi:hypothetical protein
MSEAVPDIESNAGDTACPEQADKVKLGANY